MQIDARDRWTLQSNGSTHNNSTRPSTGPKFHMNKIRHQAICFQGRSSSCRECITQVIRELAQAAFNNIPKNNDKNDKISSSKNRSTTIKTSYFDVSHPLHPVAKLTGGQGERPPPLAGHFEVFGPPVTTLLILK